jgi:dTDP-4-amino-4,6-dideoxygalactose transaminase
MKRLVTSLSPNAEADDVRLATSLLAQPWAWQRGGAIADLERAIGGFFRAQATTFESGRSALTAVIQALNIPTGSDILLQAFTCVAVPNSIRWAGCVPVYVDANPNTFTIDIPSLEKHLTTKTKALLVQHTFGVPADMDALTAFAKQHNLLIIEDCAHSFSSRWNGQLLGTFGDAAIFSLGRDKALSSVFGGVAITRRSDIHNQLRSLQSQAPLPSLQWIAQQLAHPLVLALGITLYDIASLGKVVLETAKRLRIISKAVEPQERLGKKPTWTSKRMPNALAVLALHQWKKRERFDAHRRRIAEIYATQLDAKRFTLPITSEHADPVLLRYPIRTPNRDKIFHAASKAHIQLGDWYTSPLAPSGVDETAVAYNQASTPQAVALAQETLNLPTHIHISEADARRIVDLVNSI